MCARAAWRNCNLDLPRFKFLNCHGTSLQRTDLHTGRLDLRILEDMWYAIHCSPTVSGKAACVQVIKRYQKTVGLLIVQDGFSWCFSWCLQPLNVDSCQFYDPLFSLSLSFSNQFLFLTNSLPEMPWLSNQLPAWHTQCEDHFIQEAIEWKAQGVHIQGCHCISNVRWCPDMSGLLSHRQG